VSASGASLALLFTGIVLGTTCTVYCALDLRFRFSAFSRVLSFLFGLLLVTQCSMVGVQVFGTGRPQPGMGYQILVITACGLLACSLVFNRYLFADLIGVLVCGTDVALLVLALLLRSPRPAAGAATSPLSWVLYLHVSAIVLSYVVMTLACISAVAYLLRDRGLKARRPARALDSLPPLATLETFTQRLVLVGFAALTVGIVLSQVFVLASHHSGLFFDGRESIALISWLLYAVYAGFRVLARWEGRRLAFLVIAGYATSLAPAAVLTTLNGARSF
jgi:ABC-type uncharacterized transport system permease subunit